MRTTTAPTPTRTITLSTAEATMNMRFLDFTDDTTNVATLAEGIKNTIGHPRITPVVQQAAIDLASGNDASHAILKLNQRAGLIARIS